MPQGIPCKSCKHLNRIGTLYCHSCGEKLDQRAARYGGGVSFLSIFRGFIRLLVGVACIGTVAAMLWPVKPLGEMGNADAGERFIERMSQLSAAASDGERMVQPIVEEELNSFLAQLIRKQAGNQPAGALQAGTAAINVTFTPNSLVALIIGAYGPVYLTYEIQGLPSAGEDGFRFDQSSVRLGHMPLPGALGDIMIGRVAHMFSKMEQEWALLDRIVKFQLEDGRIVVGVR